MRICKVSNMSVSGLAPIDLQTAGEDSLQLIPFLSSPSVIRQIQMLRSIKQITVEDMEEATDIDMSNLRAYIAKGVICSLPNNIECENGNMSFLESSTLQLMKDQKTLSSNAYYGSSTSKDFTGVTIRKGRDLGASNEVRRLHASNADSLVFEGEEMEKYKSTLAMGGSSGRQRDLTIPKERELHAADPYGLRPVNLSPDKTSNIPSNLSGVATSSSNESNEEGSGAEEQNTHVIPSIRRKTSKVAQSTPSNPHSSNQDNQETCQKTPRPQWETEITRTYPAGNVYSKQIRNEASREILENSLSQLKVSDAPKCQDKRVTVQANSQFNRGRSPCPRSKFPSRDRNPGRIPAPTPIRKTDRSSSGPRNGRPSDDVRAVGNYDNNGYYQDALPRNMNMRELRRSPSCPRAYPDSHKPSSLNRPPLTRHRSPSPDWQYAQSYEAPNREDRN